MKDYLASIGIASKCVYTKKPPIIDIYQSAMFHAQRAHPHEPIIGPAPHPTLDSQTLRVVKNKFLMPYFFFCGPQMIVSDVIRKAIERHTPTTQFIPVHFERPYFFPNGVHDFNYKAHACWNGGDADEFIDCLQREFPCEMPKGQYFRVASIMQHHVADQFNDWREHRIDDYDFGLHPRTIFVSSDALSQFGIVYDRVVLMSPMVYGLVHTYLCRPYIWHGTLLDATSGR